MKIALIAAALFMMADKKRRFDAPQNTLLFFLIPVILSAGIMNGIISTAIDSVVLFLTTILMPFLVVQNLINTQKKQQIVMLFLIFAAMVMVNDGMAQKASEAGVGWSGAMLSQGTRITYLGIFNDPNDLGMFLVMVMPLTLYFYQRVAFVLKIPMLASSAFILYGIYLTNSRGALLGAMSQVGLWFFNRYGLKKSMILGLVAAPAALVVMSMFRAIDSEEASAEGRLEAWYEGFQLLFWKPVVGVGMGQFAEHHYLTAHNSFVLVFSELGLSGYYLWVAFLTFSAYMLLVLWNKNVQGSIFEAAPQAEKDIARTFTYSLLGYLVTCFFLSRSYTPMLYIFCAMFVATFYRASGYEKGFKKIAFKDYSGKVFLFFTSSLVLIYFTVRFLL
ncbi:MAG: O-antigen ligase family protein [Oleiphilus sp.]